MDYINIQYYQGELGHSLHPISLNKPEGYGSLHHTQNLYLPVRSNCSDPDVRGGGHLNPEGMCSYTGVQSQNIKKKYLVHSKVHHRLSLLKLNEYFQTKVTSYPILNIFFHSRRWCNENITLFIKTYHFHDFCCLIDSLSDAIAYIAHSMRKVYAYKSLIFLI